MDGIELVRRSWQEQLIRLGMVSNLKKHLGIEGNRRWYVILLVLVLVAPLGLRVAGVVSKSTLDHDEGISYLAAAGHQGQYNSIAYRMRHPAGNWVKASQWKKLLIPDKQFAFKEISDDLAQFDIHPPLYFWLLHIWSLLFGVHVRTGPLLNVIIFLVTALFLFRLAYYVLGSYTEAVIATFIWAISPAVISISFAARHYDLLSLVTVIFVDLVIRYSDLSRLHETVRNSLFKADTYVRPAAESKILGLVHQLPEFILLSILTTVGMLTHYQFSLVVVGAITFLAMRLTIGNIQRLSMGFLSIGTGLVIFGFLHPSFYSSISRAAAQAQSFDMAEMALRINRVLDALWSFFLPCDFDLCGVETLWPSLLGTAMVLQAALFMTLVALLAIRPLKLLIRSYSGNVHFTRVDLSSSVRRNHFQELNSHTIGVCFFFLWISLAVILSYLAFRSPSHAMGARYLSMVWPFFALVLVFSLGLFQSFRKPILASLCIIMALSGSLLVSNYVNANMRQSNPLPLQHLDRIIVDNVSRGAFPRIFLNVPDQTLIFAADQNYLINHKEKWLCHLNGSSIYISHLSRGTGSRSNSRKGRQEILDLIRQEHQVTHVEGGIWGVGEQAFTLVPLTDEESPSLHGCETSGATN